MTLTPGRDPARTAIPTVAFYGEQVDWPAAEALHSEKLDVRSRRHGWHIRAHRHSNIAQLFLLLSGDGSASLDGEQVEVAAPALLLIPEGCVHEFRWRRESQGFVLSIAAPNSQRLRELNLATPAVLSPGAKTDLLATLFAEIHTETTKPGAYREAMLESLLQSICLTMARLQEQPQTDASRDRARRHFDRFLRLLEENHKSHWPVSRYGNRLGISASHLNAICRKQSGRSALEIIHARVFLAARRALTYTEMNVAQVASTLGFNDAAYFTRFFKRLCGKTPKQFRRDAGTLAASEPTNQ